MVAAAANRISDFFDPPSDPAVLPKPRTAAQIAASKSNGAKSRGPISAAGKDRARFNALKHGLLAKVLSPPSDCRGHDKLFRQIREQLVHEFRPRTFTQWAAVDRLAIGYLQRSRATAMIEGRQTVLPLKAHDQESWDRAIECRRDRVALRHAAQRLQQNGLFCSKKSAQRVATLMQRLIEQSKADLAELAEDIAQAAKKKKAKESAAAFRPAPAQPGMDLPELDDVDKEQIRSEQELLEKLGPAADRLCDRDYVMAVLQGARRAVRGDAVHLGFLVEDLIEKSKHWGSDVGDLKAKVAQQIQDSLLAIGDAPENSILLHRYQQRLDGDIRRLLRDLRSE
jgi:hypothetical protein